MTDLAEWMKAAEALRKLLDMETRSPVPLVDPEKAKRDARNAKRRAARAAAKAVAS